MNSPPYEQQIILNEYWKQIGGLTFLPGTNRASDRFVRASFLLDAIPKTIIPQYIKSAPKQSFRYQAVAEVLSLMRAVSVPLGITTPEQPILLQPYGEQYPIKQISFTILMRPSDPIPFG
ncbi:hypothetical protein FOG18_06310 [Legionella israelensis]|uniref:hypothetical protein n=1 Tax=Legionella israelensis TaxID=454 RepID=UPI00117C2FDD|nr:hypothetical protein [Legionella israelensis]QDP72201.1 hypothetical protein FOG18_06310 [Legionella israelensis]